MAGVEPASEKSQPPTSTSVARLFWRHRRVPVGQGTTADQLLPTLPPVLGVGRSVPPCDLA